MVTGLKVSTFDMLFRAEAKIESYESSTWRQ